MAGRGACTGDILGTLLEKEGVTGCGVDGIVCMQVRQPTYCSPSGAFLDDAVW